MEIYLACGLSALSAVLCVILLIRQGKSAKSEETALREELSRARREITSNVTDALRLSQNNQSERLGDLGHRLEEIGNRMEAVRSTLETRLAAMQESNEKRLDEMRVTVDEKLQKTLESRIGESFKLVSERLEQVYRGLGEMQTLAVGVGDLKKVLSNVKTRGILGEIQLSAILAEILAPEQYEENVATVPKSTNRVEFAVRLPGDGEQPVYLPIDSKFPGDAYEELLVAYEAGDPARTEAAGKTLETRIRSFAKDIRDKYVSPPYTTDFGIMFLPFEGLYAEVVRRGMVEKLQREYRVNIAGPTTMAALLNSLQMGFRTLAIERRSGEIAQVLGAVKTEFATFGDALKKAQDNLAKVGTELDDLVGVRTRQINRKLRSVTELDRTESAKLLELE